MKTKKIILLVFILCMAAAGRAAAADIDFNFEVPTMPYPPQITDVSNSAAVLGASAFTVTASITGQMQMSGFCDIAHKEDCTESDWYLSPDPNIVPNPPDIQKAMVYYYIDDDVAGAGSVDMVYDVALGRYRADVPLTGVTPDSSLTYYIVAVDSRGNVASQTPDPAQRPCDDIWSWDSSLATPATDNCAYATSYSQCGEYIPGIPSSCGSGFTMNDKNGDVCGEPNTQGVQSVITGATADKVDILGISAGADSNYLCMKMGIKAPPPTSSDPAPIEGYLVLLYNPDMYDPNPGDTHITNAYAITYAPEAVGSDPTLVKVLWSSDCVTDPNTSNPLDCKLIAPAFPEADLQIGYSAGSLYYRVKNFGTGDPYAVNYSIFGNYTKQAYIIGLTGEINLSSGTAFWIADVTPGFAFYHKNSAISICCGGEIPAAPIVLNTRCSVDGTGGTSSVCAKSVSPPPQNKCKINFNKSLDGFMVDEYRIYRNTTNSTSGAVQIGTVAENGSPTYSYTDTHTSLNGNRYYYFLSSYSEASGAETETSDWSGTMCTVEDWPPPESPVIASAATPSGNEKKCKIDWSITTPDPSLESFFINRSDDGGATYTTLNYFSPVAAALDITDYELTDGSVLELNRTYLYTVTAVDIGGNSVTTSPTACVPEDLKAPARNLSLMFVGLADTNGVNIDWNAGPESDIAGYNAYFCPENNLSTDCRSFDSFTKLNTNLLTATSYQADDDTHPNLLAGVDNFCVYVETCDNCNTLGICPSNGGAPNCNGFPPGGADSTLYVRCSSTYICENFDYVPPVFPGDVACETLPEGDAVNLSWNKICNNYDGTPFVSCEAPDEMELVGYKIIFGDRGAVPELATAPPESVAGIVPVDKPPAFTHAGRENGREYCYHIYGVDSSLNYSMEGPGLPDRTEVCCTPRDTVPPARPVLRNIEFTPVSCTPAWGEVEDNDSLTYNVYRCQGTAAECATPAQFEAAATGLITFEKQFDVPTGNEFQYCVTAVDPSGNESVVVGAGDNPNCGTCIPSDRPPPVTGVVAAPRTVAENTGAKLYWTKNPADDGFGGYNVYRCAEATCETARATVRSCVTTPATLASPLFINDEPIGDWYYGVTYLRDCGDPATESHMQAGEGGSIYGPVTVEPVCTRCIVISSCTDYDAGTGCIPVRRVNTSAKDGDGKFLTESAPGYEVFLADEGNNTIGLAVVTGSNGNYNLVISNDDNSVNLSNKYKIVLKVPAADKSGTPCSPGFSGVDCYIVLANSLTVTDDGVYKKVSGINLPPIGGGRAEAGNPDCSNSVDVGDLLILKAKFGSSIGDGKYASYADFDGNGVVDVEDFLIFKKNFGKTLDAAPAFDATLCKP